MREIRDIHEPFVAWLDKIGIPFHRNRPDKKTTAKIGDPDFLVTWMQRCLYIECKVPGNKLSQKQENRIAYLRRAGNKVVIAYSIEECIDACKSILCIGKEDLSGGVESRHAAATQLVSSASETWTGTTTKAGAPDSSTGSGSSAPPAQHLFVARFNGADYVFRGEGKPGGECLMVRRATPADLINIRN